MPEAAAALRRAGFEEWMAAILARRGAVDAASAEAFLNPRLEQLHDPRDLLGVAPAVERLLRARERGEGVAVVGDYDVDGVTGTALLTAVLRACGVAVVPIMPHRLHDGYGFQPCHGERARQRGCAVVVTVDCGSTSHAAAGAALAAGMDVVVTDHHLPGEPLPAAVVHINPRQEACAYPFAELSGAGLAFKLATAVAAACGRPVDPRVLLRVACLGTIADLVPLTGENRAIAAVGLAELGRTRSPGLRALIQAAGVEPPLTAADVGYRLGPRLNAPGRLDAADKALELLLTRQPARAAELAGELDRWNRQRQEEERRVAEEAREVFAALPALPPILVAWSERWHRGVVGIAAGRLARELHRPTILLALADGVATGSGRSVADIHLHRFLTAWAGELERFGGHARAVGLTVATDRLAALRQRWEEAAEGWRAQIAVRRYDYELTLTPRRVDRGLLATLGRLAPHGEGNPQPLARIRGPLRLLGEPKRFGRGHLVAEAAAPDGGRIRLLGWSWAARRSLLDGSFEALGYLEEDRYRGGVVLRLVDCRSHPPEGPSARTSEPPR